MHAGGTAAGTKAGVVSGVRQGDTDAAAHAIANAPPEGQGASDALGQLYNEGRATSLKGMSPDALQQTMSKSSCFSCYLWRNAILCQIPIFVDQVCSLLRVAATTTAWKYITLVQEASMVCTQDS